MRDIKTYLSTAPVLTTLWFGSLAGLLIEINRLFPDALSFPFFSFLLNSFIYMWRNEEYFKSILRNMAPISLSFYFWFRIGKKKEKIYWTSVNIKWIYDRILVKINIKVDPVFDEILI